MKSTSGDRIFQVVWGVVLGGCFLAAVSGCSTTNGEAPDPGVEIHWNTPGQISNVVHEVFLQNGFVSSRGDYTKLVFEKKGSLGENLAYGGWSREGLWVRVKVSILPAGEATFRVSCKSFRVEDRGQVLEEETPMSARQNEKFKKLLEEVAARLKSGVEAPKHEP